MSAVEGECGVWRGRARRIICGAWIAGGACLMLAVGVDGFGGKSASFSRALSSAWAAPVFEAPIFSATTPDADLMPPDPSRSIGGLRSAAGSSILIATVVHAGVLKEIAVSRIGGLYGP